AEDVKGITDAARVKWLSNLMMGLALLKNYRPFEAPPSFALIDLWRKFHKTWGLTGNQKKKYGTSGPDGTFADAMKRRTTDPWNFLRSEEHTSELQSR